MLEHQRQVDAGASALVLDAHDRQQRPAGRLLVDAGVLEDQLGLDVEDPGGVLGALDVAADPEHRLRDPAQHRGSPSLRPCCCCSACGCCSRSTGPLGISRAPWCCGAVVPRRAWRRLGVRAALVRRRLDRRAGQHPGVLGAAAARGVHDQLALGERDPGQAAGQHPDPVAVVDRERPQVDVPRRRAGRRRTSAPSRAARPAGRSTTRGSSSTLARSSSSSARWRRGPITMPLPPEPSTGLSTSSSSRSSTSSRASGVAHPPGVDVAEHRLLGEVVADQVGHVGVDELVVGDAVADRVGEGDVAGPGRVDQARGSRAPSRPGSAPGRGTRRRPAGRSRAPARGPWWSASSPGRGGTRGRGPRPARRPWCGRAARARSRRRCRRPASARRRSGR